MALTPCTESTQSCSSVWCANCCTKPRTGRARIKLCQSGRSLLDAVAADADADADVTADVVDLDAGADVAADVIDLGAAADAGAAEGAAEAGLTAAGLVAVEAAALLTLPAL